MTVPGPALSVLKRRRPEWEPWLAVVEEVLREGATATWDAAVPDDVRSGIEAPGADASAQTRSVPLLAGATIAVRASSVRDLLKRLIRIGVVSGTPKMATLAAAARVNLDVIELFEASVCQDGGRVEHVAIDCGIDAEALQAVVALLAVPFLHACTRRLASSISEGWVEGYCPVCGSWPSFAEVRGIERSRHFRCSRCDSEWHARALHCPYCNMRDHTALVSLVPENGGEHALGAVAPSAKAAVIDACTRCRGYVKTFTRLQGCAPGTVMLEDLGSVELDVAALELEYARPAGAGYALELHVTDRGPSRWFSGWNA